MSRPFVSLRGHFPIVFVISFSIEEVSAQESVGQHEEMLHVEESVHLVISQFLLRCAIVAESP